MSSLLNDYLINTFFVKLIIDKAKAKEIHEFIEKKMFTALVQISQ